MPTIINGTTGIDTVQDGIVTADKIVSGAVTDAKIAAMAASKLTGQVQRANATSGSVIQTINTYIANAPEIATTSTSLVSSGISASITPTDASNIICVEFSSAMTDPTTSSGVASVMYVNGSPMPGASSYHIAYRDSSVRYAPSVFLANFQPTNTSALTFQVFFRSLNGNSARIVHELSSYCLKLTEIKT